jgi:hypothetical protein
MRLVFGLTAIVTAGWWAAFGAAAAGGPSPGLDFGRGVAARDGAVRYVTVPAERGTVVEAIQTRSGQVLRFHYLRGTYGVPAVAWDGSTGGLAVGGRRLVLASWPGYGRQGVTRFVVLDPRTLKVRSRLVLHGAFAFDALSPQGTVMYVIQFLGGPGSGRYAVRAVDVSRGRVFDGAIVDAREPDERMTGQPVTRVGNGRGTWAYTLYSRPSGPPFVHALDTVRRRAICIDLPRGWASRAGQLRLRLSLDGRTLAVRYAAHTIAQVDTKTFEVGSG